MDLKHQFDIQADPDTVFDFLVDGPRVAACLPGVVIDEVVDPTTFKGTMKVKVGPVTVRYAGTGYITATERSSRTATIRAEAQELGAAGSVSATMVMTVVEGAAASSHVSIDTDLAIAGRVATMGRGVIEQVGNQMVAQASRQIEARVLDAAAGSTPPGPNPTGQTLHHPARATASADLDEAGLDLAAILIPLVKERYGQALLGGLLGFCLSWLAFGRKK